MDLVGEVQDVAEGDAEKEVQMAVKRELLGEGLVAVEANVAEMVQGARAMLAEVVLVGCLAETLPEVE